MNNNQIVQTMYVGKSFSHINYLCLESFIKNGHQVHLYLYDNKPEVPKDVICKSAEKILSSKFIIPKSANSDNPWGHFSDLFRYKLLYDIGGWWFDTDVYCIKSFNFKKDYVIPYEYSDFTHKNIKINCNILKFPPKNNILFEAFNEASFIVQYQKNPGWASAGPHLIHRLVNKYKMFNYFYSPEYFNPYHGIELVNFILKQKKIFLPHNCYGFHLYETFLKNYIKNNSYINSLINCFL